MRFGDGVRILSLGRKLVGTGFRGNANMYVYKYSNCYECYFIACHKNRMLHDVAPIPARMIPSPHTVPLLSSDQVTAFTPPRGSVSTRSRGVLGPVVNHGQPVNPKNWSLMEGKGAG